MNKKLLLILAITGIFFSSTFCMESEPVSEKTKTDCNFVMENVVRNQFNTSASLADFNLDCAYRNPSFKALVPFYQQAFSSWIKCTNDNQVSSKDRISRRYPDLCKSETEWLIEVNKAVFKSMEQCAWTKK